MLNIRKAVVTTLMLAVSAHVVWAQDVMKVAKDHYKILVENEFVRVVENTLAPGEKDAFHTHPAGWFYVTKPGKMKVVFATGKTELWEPKAGESGWSPAEGAHTSENVGTAPMTYVLVELKQPAKEPVAKSRSR